MSMAPWRQYPWLLGLLLAPLLFGSVNPEGQAVVGLLFAASLILLASELGGHSVPVVPVAWRWLAAILVVFPLVPLPPQLVAFLSHPRAALGQNFALDPNSVTAWLPLTLAPGETVQRLWELLLIITCFWLARAATAHAGFPRSLALWVSVALLLLAASDVWYRLHGQTTMLGLWEPSWGKGAGTFANRNHFANWCSVALLFVAGWIIRAWRPLHWARLQPLPDASRSRANVLFLLIAALFGLVMAVASGSRGGLLALVAGVVVWVAMLGQRSRSRKRWIMIGLLMIAAFVVGLTVGELVLERFAQFKSEMATRYSKIDIWRNSLAIFTRFPLFGAGWGSFATAFTLFKSFGGGTTFWHAENDYVQLLMETGLAGFVVFGFVLFRLARSSFLFAWPRSSKMAEPELVFGALAALAAFATHALYEFVFQIPATALLAAALLGFVIGCRDQAGRPALPAPPSNRRMLLNLGWAAALLVTSICQGMASLHWHQAKTALRAKAAPIAATEARRSLRIWPWSMHRQLVLTRLEVALLASQPPGEQPELAEAARARINRAIAWNPYAWELRLERAWLDLGFSTNQTRARTEAWETVKLNPLQPQIPLRFARHFADRDPDVAWQFLLSVDRSDPRDLREVLQLAWRIRGETAVLWSLAPDTPDGLLALGDFAAGQKLLPLAALAYQRLTNRVEAATLAERFLQVQRPDLALSVLPSAPKSSRELLLLARSHIQRADYVQAIRLAESVWRTNPQGKLLEASFIPVKTSLAALLERWQAQPTDARLGEELAGAICQQPAPQRDLGLLRQLAAKFPANLRLTWLVFQTERDADQFQAAAETALNLATRVAAQD